MKIQIMSDLHLEFHKDFGSDFVKSITPAADTLVLAGDILPMTCAKFDPSAFKNICKKFKHVVMVPGNHEYYGTTPAKVTEILIELGRIRNLNILYTGKIISIEDHRFIGSTMWFKYDPTNISYRDQLTDFRMIDDFIPWVYKENEKWIRFANKTIKEGDIVVTHHLPSYQLVEARYKWSEMNQFFVCDMEETILKYKPDLWIYGHTHTHSEKLIGQTTLVCNSFGYPGEESNLTFQDKYTVDTEKLIKGK